MGPDVFNKETGFFKSIILIFI